MNERNAASKETTLRDLVKVKKLRFKDTEDSRIPLPYSRDAIQRRANFEEFKVVYGDSLGRRPAKVSEKRSCPLHKTKSGSLYRIPKIKNKAKYVETINIELPLHYGADRAVQLLENKIKPKRATAKVNREVITENIVKKLKKIEEVDEYEDSVTGIPTKHVDEIQKQVRERRETMWKNLPKMAVQKPRKKHTKDKIMNVLSNINEKLEKMQRKYLEQPRVQYKSVNDCFTQSGHVEVIYENDKYPEEIKVGSGLVECDKQNVSGNTTEHFKMQESIKEMNRIFPEFPKIEDTLREIEAHLDNIVNLEADSGNIKKGSSMISRGDFEDKLSNHWEGRNLAAILTASGNHASLLDHTNKILKNVDEAKDQKLRAIRKQIEEVEEFCDRMSEIANDESCAESVSTAASTAGLSGREDYKSNSCLLMEERKDGETTTSQLPDFMEGPDLQASIKKSIFLSKEFSGYDRYVSHPMVKVFSDNDQTILWRKKMRSLEQMQNTNITNVESVTRVVNDLKFTLENSLYEAVA